MNGPRRYLTRMALFLLAVIIIVGVLYQPLVEAFVANSALNGLIVEQLESIPQPGTRVTVSSYPIEILETAEHAISRVRIFRPGADAKDTLTGGANSR